MNISPAGFHHHHHPHHHQPSGSKPVMSARDLTGAPLISLVPCKNRKVGGQAGQGPGQRKYYERQRHKSDQANIPSSYYAGQNLYQVRYYHSEGQREDKVWQFFRS